MELAKFVARSWFNLDTSWAVTLILVAAIPLVLSVANQGVDSSVAPREMQAVFEEHWRVVGCCHLSGL